MLPTATSTNHARPARRAGQAIATAAGLALAWALLVSTPAPAQAHARPRSAAHTSATPRVCPPKRRGRSTARARSTERCTKGRLPKGGHARPKRPHTGSGAGAGNGAAPTASGEQSPAAASDELPPPEVTGASTEEPAPPESNPGGSAGEGPPAASGEGSSGGAVTDPIDPRFLTAMPFGTTSFWWQPWRAYLDTWPASRLLESLGINFNVSAPQADATAQLLHDSGFKLARIEINWDSLSYEDPTRVPRRNRASARGCRRFSNHGLRPLILLDANSDGPAPAKRITLETVSEAPAGAQTVTLTPASAAEVVPGKTGFAGLSFGGDPDILITSVGPDDLATLSKPLPSALPAGPHRGATLLYAPFTAAHARGRRTQPGLSGNSRRLAQLRRDGLQGGNEHLRPRGL